MMNAPVWRVEDGVLLQNLRENAKIDDFVFARLNAISLAQLRELEGQGEGSFYNSQIKANTGNKLLRKLGHEPEIPAAEPMQTTATPLESASHALVLSGVTDAGQSTEAGRSASMHKSNPSNFNPKWAAAMLLIGGLVWTGSRMPWPELTHSSSLHEVKASAQAQSPQTTVAPDPSAAQNAVAVALPNPTPPTVATPPALSTTSTAPSDGQKSANCDWRQGQNSLSYESDNPIKAGNYIHFVAVQDVKLCVRDQKNQLTDLHLKAGSAQSVYGEPPFLVHSPSWQNLQAFFQGRRVMGTPDGSAYWLFKNRDL